MRLSEHFHDFEFMCKCCGSLGIDGVSHDLLRRLERLRADIGNEPIIIVSGYRCRRHNNEIGGARRSQHKKGNAADIAVRHLKPSTVAHIAENGAFKGGGVGRYKSWTHVDARGRKARWYG